MVGKKHLVNIILLSYITISPIRRRAFKRKEFLLISGLPRSQSSASYTVGIYYKFIK